MKLITLMLVFALLSTSLALASGLAITEIDVHVEYDEAYTYRLENRDRINSNSVTVANGSKLGVDILPGSNVTLTVRVENTFSGEEPDLRDVLARATVSEIDDGADIEEESADFELEPGDDYRADLTFLVPWDVESGNYDTIVEAEGEDRNGTFYRTEIKLKLEVKKQSHDIRISNVALSPGTVDCSRKSKLSAEIVNAGSNTENEVALEFKSSTIGINSFDRDISLMVSNDANDEERKHSKTLNIEVPSFFKAGSYPINVNLYWKNFVLFDQKIVNLEVRDCSSSAKPTKNESNGEVIVNEGEPQVQAPEGQFISAESASASIPVILSFAGAIIIAILILLIIIGMLRGNRPKL